MAIETKILPPMPAVPLTKTDGTATLEMIDNDDRIKRVLFDLQKRLDEAEARLTLGGL